MTTPTRRQAAPSNPRTVHSRRRCARWAVIVLLCCGATDLGAGTARSAVGPHTLAAHLIGPAPRGEITPDPPAIPAPTAKPLEPPVASAPPRAQQPRPQQPQAPAPQPPEGPAPQPQAPAPAAPAPPPPPAQPSPPRPPGGHVQLSP
ncbi:hypothetical protein [Mycobacterium sherrisii]|uniref:hypothetical protein n=1 Tax=Mycobacterium sherrisii TaxID=243061 RepID=UPI001150F637|nr:hypothetical protein [Mycobacterium sherrisii]MCV7031964.1 hypothetical protein [Mycobacterium sherrisii]